ncbi:carbamoyl phosphate synthase large subunit [Bradyrhizobium diazoefficiens]|uniref:ATP-grasp domain-containing protein n=1 Tax=Bradyrhizobium diazoefficiens TaxID=1355477 RepID=UPI000BE8DA94|nr:ATP-grasp domain-containing protein [Bradyrhizobium diazoefficiens]PDT58078.1 carbamoyl phosphate synthase large subunit [Bradyrhizobium diazoefficiens]
MTTETPHPRILIAGVAGASLGTEIAKCLRHAGGYEIFGSDISPFAYGHYDRNFDSTFLVERGRYIDDLLALCRRERIDCLIPGGDEPAVLISRAEDRFSEIGIRICHNNAALVDRLSHKGRCFEILSAIDIATPATATISSPDDLRSIPLPCIIKPATGSGGSSFVFFARTYAEAELYCGYLRNNKRIPVAQQYIPHERGEFTVGVISRPDGNCAGAIALRRSFNSKLSVAIRGDDFVISSGYSQGQIEDFPEICAVASLIAQRLQSTGPLNIQGRVAADGRFVPFEINARFSASTFLRTLAGFNEVDFYTRLSLGQPPRIELGVKPGWYLRTLSEVAILPQELKR